MTDNSITGEDKATIPNDFGAPNHTKAAIGTNDKYKPLTEILRCCLLVDHVITHKLDKAKNADT